MAQALTPDQRADRLASRQFALITFEQALSRGLSPDQIKRRVESKRWVRVAKGVYRMADAPVTWQQTALAAVAAGPRGALASHLTACALYGWHAAPPGPHIVVPQGRSIRSAVAVVHRATLATIDCTLVGVVPATAPHRTLVDVAALGDAGVLTEVADNALCSRMVTAAGVEAALGRAERAPGRAGGGLLRALLRDWDPVIRPGSPAEMRALRLLKQWGFGTPVKQHVIRDERGGFVAKVDLAWVAAKVVGEYDSRRFHGATRWRRDEPRYAAIARAGYASVTIDKADLLPGERRLRDDLERAFAAQRARAG